MPRAKLKHVEVKNHRQSTLQLAVYSIPINSSPLFQQEHQNPFNVSHTVRTGIGIGREIFFFRKVWLIIHLPSLSNPKTWCLPKDAYYVMK